MYDLAPLNFRRRVTRPVSYLSLIHICYKGWFTLEADYYLKEKFNAENVFEGMKDLHTAAVRFEKLFDEA